eukprot:TRINITY_DN84566_c0_g1_i1.p1 TRINITY_DN84566_c0_g1~~TRINITY_DN84566_c0_g1_i1.p1  ORF type:complete len:196 (-),score=58.19 TRINITY_DN84566_c0_g1_i1:170-757(-)
MELARVAKWTAIVLGCLAATLVVLYLLLRWYVARQKAAIREQKAQKKAAAAKQEKERLMAVAQAAAAEADEGTTADGQRRRNAVAAFRPKKIERDPESLQKEQELKRDALHIFRKLQATSVKSEKASLCGEAVKLFDAIESRVGTGMASLTSGKIVYCNALMECGGLDELRECQDTECAHSADLIERVVPIIFST